MTGWLVALGALAAVPGAHGQGEPPAIVALVGAGRDTTVVNAFFPETIRIRVGDTVTWSMNSDEPHTVTFPATAHGMAHGMAHDMAHDEAVPPFVIPVPDGAPGELMANPEVLFPSRMPGSPVEAYDGTSFVNSGLMSDQPMGPDMPPNDTFSVTFTEPGIYTYHCALHPHMHGVVEVVDDPAADVPSQSEIDAQAQAEMEPLLARVEAARMQGEVVRSEPGPGGATIWYVRAGAIDASSGDMRAHAFDFMPENLTISAGDAVVWSSPEFHTITFSPLPPAPEIFTPRPQEEGPPLLIVNPAVFEPAKPAGVYDELQYFNSGIIGLFSPSGQAWTLAFEEPGTYAYFCAVHREMGMEGTITVLPRD